MRVLIACEESQRVCIEMRKLGHEAYSCDIQEPSGGHPEWHILGDVLKVINGHCEFTTMNGERHAIEERWDLIIAHPPCTYLTAASAVRLFDSNHNIKDKKRYWEGRKAKLFFKQLLNADCEKIAVENPAPLKIWDLPKYDQIIQPYMFGDPWQKRTCLWLQGLPKLSPTDIVEPKGYWIAAHGKGKVPNGIFKGFRDQKTRSKTFSGIAKAMAEQWAGKTGEEE